MDDVFVRIIDMPDNVRGFVIPCEDGYNVYISSRLDRLGRIKAFEHEMKHIIGNDFVKRDVHQIENNAHFNAF